MYAEQIRLLFNSVQYFWCCVTLLFGSSLIKVLFLDEKGDVWNGISLIVQIDVRTLPDFRIWLHKLCHPLFWRFLITKKFFCMHVSSSVNSKNSVYPEKVLQWTLFIISKTWHWQGLTKCISLYALWMQILCLIDKHFNFEKVF